MEFSSSYLLSLSTFVYLGAMVLYFAHLIFRINRLGLMASAVTVVGLGLQTVGLALRWKESYDLGYGHAPLSNLYESLVFFAWVTILVYLFLELKLKNRAIGAFVTPFAVGAMAYASFASGVNDSIQPLIPALQSNWLIAHVITCFIGYASFAVACGLGVVSLLKGDGARNGLLGGLPSRKVLDELIHQAIIFGFLWLTLGIITGAVWANQAWGTYWSWDPKETWSLITWFFYATALHARFVRGWTGRRIAWLSIIGFISVLFTYFGVNFLLSGLHSYGSS